MRIQQIYWQQFVRNNGVVLQSLNKIDMKVAGAEIVQEWRQTVQGWGQDL